MSTQKSEKTESNNTEVWKFVCVALVGLLTGMGSMVAREHFLIKDFITKAEAHEMVLGSSPYVKDQKYIIEKLKSIDDEIKEINKKISR